MSNPNVSTEIKHTFLLKATNQSYPLSTLHCEVKTFNNFNYVRLYNPFDPQPSTYKMPSSPDNFLNYIPQNTEDLKYFLKANISNVAAIEFYGNDDLTYQYRYDTISNLFNVNGTLYTGQIGITCDNNSNTSIVILPTDTSSTGPLKANGTGTVLYNNEFSFKYPVV